MAVFHPMPVATLRRVLVASCLIGLCSAATAADLQPLKAAIVFNLLTFAEWPADALEGGDVVALCIDGRSPMLPALKALAGRPFRASQTFELQELGASAPPKRCLALLVDGSPRVSALRRQWRHQAVLVIADDKAPAEDEPAVRLVEAQDRIGFEVDLAAARAARVRLNARLLRLARGIKE